MLTLPKKFNKPAINCTSASCPIVFLPLHNNYANGYNNMPLSENISHITDFKRSESKKDQNGRLNSKMVA